MAHTSEEKAPLATDSGGSGRLGALPASPDVLFVYGTLQFPEVLRALLGRVPHSRPVSAHGWRAAALVGRVYPGLVLADQVTDGLLLDDLTPAEWQMLDDFEDDRYELRRLPLVGGGLGWAYVWPGEETLPGNWNATEFTARHLDAYAARCAGIAARRAGCLGQ
ncbi:gamma-glutamylcyclotransferase family protein [Streptomyces specialis]|uniref:gamma-glutamylcyclotransferase family protein n=1 Tax=Streptomyces specialis TaxID=498367 RepID=UPI00099F0064|nr:gamma-glutamylcyclotransferase family protein [Streptomyces specialis]